MRHNILILKNFFKAVNGIILFVSLKGTARVISSKSYHSQYAVVPLKPLSDQ